MTEQHYEKTNFLKAGIDRSVLVTAALLTLVYFVLIAFTFEIGNIFLFTLLILGEIFHVFQVGMYLATVWDMDYEAPHDENFVEPVDVFITVAGEPVGIVEETVRAAQKMEYPSFRVHILNDGYVVKKENWKDMEEMAARLGVNCITRRTPGGAKAGNINNGLRETQEPFVVIFDADHVPHEDFLRKTMRYFADSKVGFVQSPQYYKNYATNYVTRSSWEQQQLFFGPICRGKNRWNATTMCGTNMVIRREALLQAGGIAESIAEDFLTGVTLHSKGWKSVYVPEVLAEGLAPEDFLSYYKQQFRWARGSLDVIFPKNKLLSRGLTWRQRLQYFSSISFYLSGLVVAMNALIPIVYFFTGAVPIVTSTMLLAAIFLPYIFLTLYILQKTSNYTFTFRSLAFSMGQFHIHCLAIWSALTRQKVTFSITPKTEQSGNFIKFVIPHIVYIAAAFIGMSYAFHLNGLSAAFIANSAWALLNVGIFIPMIYAAAPKSEKSQASDRVAEIIPTIA